MIRVLLADDENLIRAAIAALLGMEADLEVIAQAASGTEAVAMARRHRPDVPCWTCRCPAWTASRWPRNCGPSYPTAQA